jgi:uncharacterized protein
MKERLTWKLSSCKSSHPARRDGSTRQRLKYQESAVSVIAHKSEPPDVRRIQTCLNSCAHLWRGISDGRGKGQMPSATLQIDGPKNAKLTIALAHGAGAGMDSEFMTYFATELAAKGFKVARFEFPYMAAKHKGQSRPPDREPVLRETWLQVVKQLGPEQLVIGGKSMGGRIASMVAHEAGVAGLVCLGYPFHPVSKPEKLRVEHLRTIKTPMLIVQGERDPFGSKEEVKAYNLPKGITIEWLRDGEHSFKPRKSSGVTEEQNRQQAVDAIVAFVQRLA